MVFYPTFFDKLLKTKVFFFFFVLTPFKSRQLKCAVTVELNGIYCVRFKNTAAFLGTSEHMVQEHHHLLHTQCVCVCVYCVCAVCVYVWADIRWQ